MTTYIALLRGINVSGHRLIKMTDLRAMFEAMGLSNVQTYIQSGNVIFQSGEPAEALRPRIEAEILRVFGFDVPVALLTTQELEQVVKTCPYDPEAESIYISFMAEPASPEGIDRLRAYAAPPDEFQVVGRAVYGLYRQPVHKSKLTNNLIEKRLGVPTTARNWQTTTKLLELAKVMP